uniref:Uncharacterized protein n=1 Tax=Avena sativa TaxID=4498 RepID=A0ACD5WII9_AVESA
MGILGAEPAAPNGGSNLPSFPGFLGRKNKYVRMDDVATPPEEHGGGGAVRVGRSRSSTRYVFACSVFASLNSVLLGYGTSGHIPGIAGDRIRDADFNLVSA